MATAKGATTIVEQTAEKGLKSGAIGLISSTVIATASVAPAYSLAATLGFIVVAVGLKSPIIAILAIALPTPPAPTSRMRMSWILTRLGTKSSVDVELLLRKPLQETIISARTVAPGCLMRER